MKSKKNYPRLPPRKAEKVQVRKAEKVQVRKRAPVVIQPSNAYPRYTFDFVLRNKKGTLCKVVAAAYTTDLAEQQAKSLAYIWGYEYVKVLKRERLSWKGVYQANSKRSPPWLERALKHSNA